MKKKHELGSIMIFSCSALDSSVNFAYVY